MTQISDKWRQKASDSRAEASRIRQTIKMPTDAEERCLVRAEIWDMCANEFDQWFGKLNAPS